MGSQGNQAALLRPCQASAGFRPERTKSSQHTQAKGTLRTKACCPHRYQLGLRSKQQNDRAPISKVNRFKRDPETFKFLAARLPPDSTGELLLLFRSSSECLLGQVPISQSECSRAYLAFHKTLQSEAQQQQTLFRRWLRGPIEGKINSRLTPKRLARRESHLAVCDSRIDLLKNLH